MKRCPECRRDYYDDSLLYCRDDGSALLEGPVSMDEPLTAILSAFGVPPSGGPAYEPPTRVFQKGRRSLQLSSAGRRKGIAFPLIGRQSRRTPFCSGGGGG